MAATRSNNTFSEALANLNRSIADMKLLADADLPWLVNIETQLLDRARAAEQQMQQQGMIPTPPINPQGAMNLGLPQPGPGGMPPGMPPGGPMPGGPGGAIPPPPPGPPGAAPLPADLGAGGVPGVPPAPNVASPADLDAVLA